MPERNSKAMKKADKKLNTQTALIIAAIGSLLMAALLVLGGFKFVDNIKEIARLSNDIKINSASLELSEKMSKSKDALLKRYNSLKNKIPSKQQQGDILTQIEQVASAYADADVSIQFKEEKKEGDFTVYPVEVTIDNIDYFSLMSMISDFTKTDRFFRLDEMQVISVDDNDDAEQIMKGRLIISAFKK